MDFIFIGLSLGCAGFLGKIIMDYFNEVPVWKEKISTADQEISDYTTQLQDLTRVKERAAAESKTIDDDIKKMESMASELKAEIEKTKKEMARKGKIIMRRQPDQQEG
jgi:peptidoglycan hydrolase CwlO-like protein